MERQYKAFKRLHYVLKFRLSELALTCFIGACVLVSSATLVFYVEREAEAGVDGGPNRFTSIGASMWWASITMTTVGPSISFRGSIFTTSQG